MQKLSKILSLGLAVSAAAWLSSCDGIDPLPTPNGPTISITDAAGNSVTEITGVPGDQVTLTASGTTDAGFNVLRVTVFNGVDQVGDPTEYLSGDAGDTTFSIDFTYTFEEAYIDAPLVIEFLIVDDTPDGTAQADVDVTTSEPPAPIDEYGQRLLYAPLTSDDSETFYSTNLDQVWTKNEVDAPGSNSPNIDFGYYYGATNEASLASIADYPSNVVDLSGWNTRNATNFWNTGLSGAEAWSSITNGNDIANLLESATDDGGVITNLAVDQIVLFQVDPNKSVGNPGKYGVLYVTTINGSFNQGDYIDLAVKIQQ